VEGIPFETHARVPGEGAAIAIEIFVGLVIVVLFHPHHDAVPDERAHAARMRIVGRADVCERRVIAILIMINALPGPIRILTERVTDFDHWLQRRQREGLIRDRNCGDRPGARFQKLSSC